MAIGGEWGALPKVTSQTWTYGGGVPQAPNVPNIAPPGSVINPGTNTGPLPGYSAGKVLTPPSLATNPFQPSAVASAQTAGTQSTAQGGQNIGQADFLRFLARQGGGAAGQVLNTGMDPQGALYNRTAQQLQDQIRVGQGARGITMSPYGAGLENKAMSDFNIDWQNNLLNRQISALGAFGTASNAATGTSTGGANIGQQGVGQTQAGGYLPYQQSQENQANDINNWLAIISAGQANYPIQLAEQSMRSGGGVPFIPQNSGTTINF